MSESQEELIDLREYIAVLKRRKWSVILVTLLVLGAVMAFSYSQTPIYAAAARLLVAPPSGSAGIGLQPVTYIITEAELLASEPVADLVKEDLGLSKSASALLEDLTIADVPDASVLAIIFTSTEPETAKDVANSFARSYITFKQERALEETRGLQRTVQAEIDEVTEQLGLISDQLEEARTDFVLTSTLEDQRSVLLAQLGVLQQQLNNVVPEQSGALGGEVIQAAQLPQAPSSPNHLKNGLLAAFVGLALGIGLAFLRERLDDKIKGRSDAEKTVGVPVLATIPWFGTRRSVRRKRANAGPITLTHPKAPASEAYRNLRTNLQFIMVQRSVKSILVTSAASAEGKTTTCANLAVAMAQAGKRVILVSADMRRPALEKYFSIKKNAGLANWLMGEEAELNSLIADPGIPNLRILPCGAIPANPAELLTSINVARLIRTLETNADLVIVDAPPVLAVADANIISSIVGGVLMVLHESSTHRSGVKRATEEIEQAGGKTIGVVLNAWDQSGSTYYDYGSGYQEAPSNADTTHASDESGTKRGSDKRSRLRIGSK